MIMGVSKTNDHIQIKIKMTDPSEDPPVSLKSPNQDFKEMDILCTNKSRERAKIWKMGVPKTNDHIQIKIQMLIPIRNLQHSLKPNIRT